MERSLAGSRRPVVVPARRALAEASGKLVADAARLACVDGHQRWGPDRGHEQGPG
ncbi:MAG TPA: hypothetical protein VIG75_00570 [Citricoccus sp.]